MTLSIAHYRIKYNSAIYEGIEYIKGQEKNFFNSHYFAKMVVEILILAVMIPPSSQSFSLETTESAKM